VTSTELTRRRLWAGRSMVLIGILLLALSLRIAVAAISPITAEIGVDIPLDGLALGVIGMVPPIAFSICGVIGALWAKRIGLERLLVFAIAAMIVGHLLRAFAPNFAVLLIGTYFALFGAGMGNVLLPPIVKRYFPDRVGLVTSLYATLISVSAAIPAALAAPIADTAGWRAALGLWSLFAIASFVPWLIVVRQHRQEQAALAAAGDEAPELEEPRAEVIKRIWHSRVAWTIAVVFALSSFHVYALYAWLPRLLIDTAGVTAIQAGSLLALFSIIGLPASLIVPVLIARVTNVSWMLLTGIAAFVVGYLGLLVMPATATWLWIGLIGAGPLLFPACLALINLRTRTHDGSVALSGFTQAIGYAIGAFGPLLFGLLHTLSGGWVLPILLLIVTALACVIPAARLAKPVFVEDQLAARH
jgi:CP family cyanate transporter-like MFS transporter